jgi:hypothetical protein
LDEADFSQASVETFGPNGCFGAVLYVEKEGFMPLFERVKLAERYDIAIMSSKGMSVTAARDLVNHLNVPVVVLHDFDASGIIIVDTLANSTRRYAYGCHNVIDIGLQYGDIGGLADEPANCNISADRLAQAGLGQGAIDFLSGPRVELNAMTSRQLIDFVENKLREHGIKKVIPEKDTLEKTYRMFAASDRLSEAYDEMSEKLEKDEAAKEAIAVPDDLEVKIEKLLKEKTRHHVASGGPIDHRSRCAGRRRRRGGSRRGRRRRGLEQHRMNEWKENDYRLEGTDQSGCEHGQSCKACPPRLSVLPRLLHDDNAAGLPHRRERARSAHQRPGVRTFGRMAAQVPQNCRGL